MKRSLWLLSLLFAAPLALQDVQAAGSDYDDLDGDSSKPTKKKVKSRRDFSDEDVREIAKGFYAKSNIGGWVYLLDFMGYVKPGTSLALAVGQDFVDKERSSMAWEVAFFQGIHNGVHYETQGADGCMQAGGAAPCVEGDLRTYTFTGTLEWSAYVNRRLGIGLRGGGGLLYSPLLMDQEAYESKVLIGEWGIADPGYHNAAHPAVMVGPTFEYYTKMSHFSAGADIDAIYAIGFDLGLSMTGYFKYTF